MGWGPRGDSGPARGRVRATQPSKKILPFHSPFVVRRSALELQRFLRDVRQGIVFQAFVAKS